MTTPGDARPPMRFVTLAGARAMECNGCGDCCDSRRTDGSWTWAGVPSDQYRALAGQPLIIPLERIASGWRDRAWRPGDDGALAGTRFRCAALVEQPDGRALCGRHTEPRPPVCAQFPVNEPGMEDELAAHGEIVLNTSWLPRCAWYRTTVVRDGDPRLSSDRT